MESSNRMKNDCRDGNGSSRRRATGKRLDCDPLRIGNNAAISRRLPCAAGLTTRLDVPVQHFRRSKECVLFSLKLLLVHYSSLQLNRPTVVTTTLRRSALITNHAKTVSSLVNVTRDGLHSETLSASPGRIRTSLECTNRTHFHKRDPKIVKNEETLFHFVPINNHCRTSVSPLQQKWKYPLK